MAMTIQQAHELLMKEFTDFKTAHQTALDTALSQTGSSTTLLAEHKELLERMTTKLGELDDQYTQIQVRLNRPGSGGADAADGKRAQTPEEKTFSQWTRKGSAPDIDTKLLSVGDDTQGGYTVPPTRVQTILQTLIQFSPIRELANVVTLSTGDTWEQPKEGATRFAASRSAETGSRAQTTAANLAMETVRAFWAYANPFATQQMLDDAGFNFDGWLDDRLGQAFAVMEGAEHIVGTGVGQAEGLLSDASITELQALPYGSQLINSGNAAELTGDGIINLMTGLPEFYARNGMFIAKRQTFGAIRLLKDGMGQYLWQPGLSAGIPNQILGRPYREAIDMPAVAANAYALIYGDIRRAYTILDRQGMTMVRDPFTSKPNVELYTTWRSGGKPVLREAYVVQKVAV